MQSRLLSFVLCTLPFWTLSVQAEDVVRLESITGAESEYSVAQLLRVELMGDSIRFIASDGSVTAEVYKYDYVKLTIADQPEGIEEPSEVSHQPSAQKIVRDGRIYILFGDKAYLITGTEVR